MKQARIKIFSSFVLLAISVFCSFGYSQSNGRGGWDGENGKLRIHTRIGSMLGTCARGFGSPECNFIGLKQCIDEAITAARAEESQTVDSQSPSLSGFEFDQTGRLRVFTIENVRTEVAGIRITDSERSCFEAALKADPQIPN